MKKFYGILLCLALMAFKVHAQTPCSAVSAYAVNQNTPSGGNNLFGVMVSIAQVYYEDITVNGFIYETEGNANLNTPFYLTIPAGSLYAETSSTLLETSSSSTATVNITSVSPCPSSPINYNISIGNQFQSLSNNYNIDSIGKWHNDFLDYLYFRGSQDGLLFTDTDFLSKFNDYFSDFLASKDVTLNGGLTTVDSSVLHAYFDNNICNSDLSQNAQTIICNLNTVLSDYNSGLVNVSTLASQCDSLQIQSQNLSSTEEKIIVGGTISVAKNSSQYWAVNFDNFVDQFSGGTAKNLLKKIPINNFPDFLKNSVVFNKRLIHGPNVGGILRVNNDVPWWSIGQWDLSGAWNGGRAGAAGGAAGAVAGAILGAAIGSSIRVLGYAIYKAFH